MVRKPLRPPVKKAPTVLFLGPWITRLGLDQAEVARGAKISPGYLSQLISGNPKPKRPSLSLGFALADAIGVTLDDLRKPPPGPSTVDLLRGLSPKARDLLTGQ